MKTEQDAEHKGLQKEENIIIHKCTGSQLRGELANVSKISSQNQIAPSIHRDLLLQV